MRHLKSIVSPARIFKKEYLGIVIALLFFFSFPQLVRGIDPGAAPIDPGALSAIIMAIVAVMVFKLVTWLLIRAIWPVFARYSSQQFELNFKSLLSWQKVLVFLGFYCILLFAFVLVLLAIM